MKKLVILMTLILATSTAALANPIFGDRGAEASNAVYQTNCCFDYTTDGEIELTHQTWNFSDSDSDGDGLSDIVEGRVEDDGTIYCWGRSCEVPAKANLGDKGPVYCWGNRCELPSEVMQPDYDGEVYCWGNRCEPPTEKANGGGKVYSWGSGFPASENSATDPSHIENSSEEAQESISKRSARTGRNPETGKEIQSEGDSEDEYDSETEGEISDGINPVNDPPQTRIDRFRSSVSGLVGILFRR